MTPPLLRSSRNPSPRRRALGRPLGVLLPLVVALQSLTACASPSDEDRELGPSWSAGGAASTPSPPSKTAPTAPPPGVAASPAASPSSTPTVRPSDPGATAETITVLENLHRFRQAAQPRTVPLLYGQQESNTSNRSMHGLAPLRSDVENLVGALPSLISYELANVDRGSTTVFDPAAFRAGSGELLARIRENHRKGILTSLVWHPRCPKASPSLPDSYRPSDCPSDYTLDELRWRNKNNQKGVHYDEWRALLDALADLFLAAKDDQGKPIPLQFRPFHEFTGNWFWWGHQNPADVYQSAWVEMVQYLRNDRGVHNLLLVFCPNTPSSNGFSFEPYYPGDDFVDVVGFDRYDFNDGNFVAGFAADIETMGTFARAHGKVAAVTEVGFALHNYGLTTRPQWFTDSLVGPLFLSKGAQEFAYVAPWRNAPWEKYMPEAGDGAIADNFRSMVSSQRVLLQDAQRNLYRSLGVLPTVSPPGPSGSTPRTPTSNGS